MPLLNTQAKGLNGIIRGGQYEYSGSGDELYSGCISPTTTHRRDTFSWKFLFQLGRLRLLGLWESCHSSFWIVWNNKKHNKNSIYNAFRIKTKQINTSDGWRTNNSRPINLDCRNKRKRLSIHDKWLCEYDSNLYSSVTPERGCA